MAVAQVWQVAAKVGCKSWDEAQKTQLVSKQSKVRGRSAAVAAIRPVLPTGRVAACMLAGQIPRKCRVTLQ